MRGLYPAAGGSLWGASRRCPAAGSGAIFVPCGGPGIDPAADQQTEQVQGEEERGDEDHAEQLRTPLGRQLREGNGGQFDAGQAPGPGPLGVPFGGEPTEACGDQRPEEGNPARRAAGRFRSVRAGGPLRRTRSISRRVNPSGSGGGGACRSARRMASSFVFIEFCFYHQIQFLADAVQAHLHVGLGRRGDRGAFGHRTILVVEERDERPLLGREPVRWRG